MRFLVAAIIACTPLLAGCHRANPRAVTQIAQCMGAMGLEHEYIVHAQSPRYDLLPPLTAAIVYYKYRLRVAQVPDQGRAEAKAFVDANYRNHDLIGKMVTACGHKLTATPEFRANYDDLLRVGIESDYACKPDPTRCRTKPS